MSVLTLKRSFSDVSGPVAKPRQTLVDPAADVRTQVKDVLAVAAASQSMLEAVIKNGCKRIGYQPTVRNFKMAPVKTFRRSYDKVQLDYEGDASRLCDGCRGMQIIDDQDATGLKAAASHYRNHPDTLSFNDMIMNPTDNGFSGFNVKTRLANGHVAEIVVLTRSMARVYNQTHEAMEKAVAIIRRCKEDGLRQLPHELGRRFSHFNDCARALHDRANQNSAASFAAYRAEYAQPEAIIA